MYFASICVVVLVGGHRLPVEKGSGGVACGGHMTGQPCSTVEEAKQSFGLGCDLAVSDSLRLFYSMFS